MEKLLSIMLSTSITISSCAGFLQIDDSVEKVQADLFERHICGGLKMSILQYSMVMFWCNNLKGISSCSCSLQYDSSLY